MTCFFPCAGAALKTEGTRAQPTAVSPPPARQLGAAGEPPMPAPSRQGATASLGQVRLRGDPPSGPRGSAAGHAGQADGTGEPALRGCPREPVRAALPACGCGRAARTEAPLGASPSSGAPPAPLAARGRAAPGPRHPCPPAGGTERRPARGGACRGGLRAPGGVCECACASRACVCVSHGACASGDSAAAAPGVGQKFWGRAPQCWRGAEPAVARLGQRDIGEPRQRGVGTARQEAAGRGQRDRERADGLAAGLGPAVRLPGAVSGADGSPCNRDAARAAVASSLAARRFEPPSPVAGLAAAPRPKPVCTAGVPVRHIGALPVVAVVTNMYFPLLSCGCP